MDNKAYNEQLEELATQAIDRVAELEKENAGLRKDLGKKASAVPSEEAIEQALEALQKSGSLLPEQIEATRDCFKNDPDAAFRAITGLALDASDQVKTASNEALNGGRIVNVSPTKADYHDALADRMVRILSN